MTTSTAHVYRGGSDCGQPLWGLGLGFDTFVCWLDPRRKFGDAALHLMARGWRRTGEWARDELARIEKWTAPVESDGLSEGNEQ